LLILQKNLKIIGAAVVADLLRWAKTVMILE
jgi:hypothetical protein